MCLVIVCWNLGELLMGFVLVSNVGLCCSSWIVSVCRCLVGYSVVCVEVLLRFSVLVVVFVWLIMCEMCLCSFVNGGLIFSGGLLFFGSVLSMVVVWWCMK